MSEPGFQLVEGRRRHFTWVGVCEGLITRLLVPEHPLPLP